VPQDELELQRWPKGSGLTVDDLQVDAVNLDTDIVAGVSFRVAPGSALGLVGESGSGKTTTALALLGFARPGTAIVAGSVTIAGVDVLAAKPADLQHLRGRTISYVPQNPSRSLSPSMRIGRQLAEIVDSTDPAALKERIAMALSAAQCPTGEDFLRRFPHEISGGQQQRVAIAMALVGEPDVIVMDEPTTGLDVLTQARFLDVLRTLRSQNNAAIVYVSHDLGVVRNLVDHVAVMYGGRIVEEAPVDEFFRAPNHPYSRRLLEAVPRIARREGAIRGIPGTAVEPWNRPSGCVFVDRCEFATEVCRDAPPPATLQRTRMVRCWNLADVEQSATPRVVARPDVQPQGAPALFVEGVCAEYRKAAGLFKRRDHSEVVRAVDDVSFELRTGECLAIVGESGSGKSTLARTIAGLHQLSAGTISLSGGVLPQRAGSRTQDARRRIQIVFQDPDSSLNPRRTVAQSIGRPLRQYFDLTRVERNQRIEELLELVRVPSTYMAAFPHELSGGQKQRVALARALAAKPDVLICDEVTSALDVAVQASVLTLLDELRREFHMAMLFISHDLAVVSGISETTLIMRHGRVEESGPTERVFEQPESTYAVDLLAAVPDLDETDYPAAAGVSLT